MRRRKHPEFQAQVLYGETPVEIVRIEDAAKLFTFREGDATASTFIKGAIVRVIPSGESTGPERAELRDFLLGYGAAHVWLAPRAAARQVLPPVDAVAETPEEPPRTVIMRMVDESHTRDRELLRHVIEAAITAENL